LSTFLDAGDNRGIREPNINCYLNPRVDSGSGGNRRHRSGYLYPHNWRGVHLAVDDRHHHAGVISNRPAPADCGKEILRIDEESADVLNSDWGDDIMTVPRNRKIVDKEVLQ